MVAPRQSDLALYRRVLRQARPFWPHIAGVFLLSLLSSPIALLTPLPVKIVVDSVVGQRPVPAFLGPLLPANTAPADTRVLLLATGLVVAIALIGQLLSMASQLLHDYTSECLVLRFRAQLFRYVQRLSLAYHDSRGTTDSLYRIQYDAAAIQWIAVDGIAPFVTAATTLAGMIYVTARLDWQLALVALGACPILFVAARTYRKRLKDQWRDVKHLESASFSVVQEVLSAVRVVKAFGREDQEEERFFRRANQGLRARMRVILAEGGFGLVVGLTIAAGTAAVLFVGARHVQAQVLTLGELLLVMAYLGQLYKPLESMSRMVGHLQASLASAERAFALLDEAPEVLERPDARPLRRATGAVAFRNVSFAFESNRPILESISFELAPGSRLGIAGTTGAGKTTLVSLLTRFYDPTTGQILLDGVDLRDYRLADLRRQFAVVLQEPVLFSTSIAENIAYGDPTAGVDAVVAAAAAAHAHEFISRLPDGYQTRVGERGMRLSGGERQRISLARAFLKDAPILILDEPTSSVDVRTEGKIMEAMERLMRGRTTLMIAHRLTTLESCDLQLRLEHGRLVGAAPEAFSHGVPPDVSGSALALAGVRYLGNGFESARGHRAGKER